MTGGEGQPLPREETWDRVSERLVYPAIALTPDPNHRMRNQSSLNRESACILFQIHVESPRERQTRGVCTISLTFRLFPFGERGTHKHTHPSLKRRLSAGLHTFQEQPRAPLGSAEPFVPNPAYITCASASQNNPARRCQRKYRELLNNNTDRHWPLRM